MPNFDSGPSIVELFLSAKKLLPLQHRVKNLEVRKDSSSCQRTLHVSDLPRPGGSGHTHDRVLDLLSPLLIDDLKTTPTHQQCRPSTTQELQKASSTTTTTNASVQPSAPTPMSLNSPPSEKGAQRDEERSRKSIDIKSMDLDAMEGIQETEAQGVPSRGIQRLHSNMALKREIHSPSTAGSPSAFSLGSLAPSAPKITECTNCHTQNTPLWRKDPHGNTLCNACGLFYKLHGTTRPLSLKTDVIKKRLSRRSTNPVSRHALVTSLSLVNNPVSVQRNLAPIAKPSSYSAAPVSFLNSLPSSTRYKNVLILPKPSQNTNTTTSPSSAASSVPGTPNSLMSVRSIPIPRTASHLSMAGSHPSSLPLNMGTSNQLFKRKKSDFNIASNPDYFDFGRRSTSSLVSGSVKRTGGAKRTSSVTSMSHLLQPQSQSLSLGNINLLNQRFNSSFFDSDTRRQSVSTVAMSQNGVAPHDVTTPGSFSSQGSLSMRQHSSFVDFRRTQNAGLSNIDGDISSIPATPLNTALLPSSQGASQMEMDATYFKLHRDRDTTPLASPHGEGYKSSLSNGLKRQMAMQNEKEFKDLDWLKFEL